MIPKSHPRYESLMLREKISQGLREGIVHETGLIAHGRGEAYDYLLGEQTIPPANIAERMAAALLLSAKKPVLSVNGNVAALAAHECCHLADTVGAKLEVNLFHHDRDRMKRIVDLLYKNGARDVLGLNADKRIPGLEHPRGICCSQGIYHGDVILVPLEDGDRCQALRDMGKTVVTVDLNPLSRTARAASVTIVDNVIRALPQVKEWAQKLDAVEVQDVLKGFDNRICLQQVLDYISHRLTQMSHSSK